LHSFVHFTGDERRNRSRTSIAADSIPESVENPCLAFRLYVSALLRHEADEKQKLAAIPCIARARLAGSRISTPTLRAPPTDNLRRLPASTEKPASMSAGMTRFPMSPEGRGITKEKR